MKKPVLLILAIASFVCLSLKVSLPVDKSMGVSHCLQHFRNGADHFLLANQNLYTAIKDLNADSLSVYRARRALTDCRRSYKNIAFFTAYFFPSETRFYNAAPKFEVEEPTLELVEPMGLQQIEALLFEGDVMANKSTLLTHSEAMLTSGGDLTSLLYGLEISDAQILESLRIELIRISTLYISGYDAPMLKSGIIEAMGATKAIQNTLTPYFAWNDQQSKSLEMLLTESQNYLRTHSDFDTFNRLEYLTRFALPMQTQLGEFVSALGLGLNTTAFLNDQAPHIYSKNALKVWDHDGMDSAQNKALVDLGRSLFFDKTLSGNASTSCATCHQPENFFTDNLRKSPSLAADSILKRNTPTLLYAGWQHSQFWDGRAANLKDQVHDVVFNPLEMNGRKEAFNVRGMDIGKVSEALSAFIKQLSPMDSPFDHYINGDPTALTDRQVNGFNLFMGKAQCGTCHFPPFFNSLLPPLFELSEVEILGVTASDDFENPELDLDAGRYDLYKMKYYKGAFKTPTVRNAAKTGPYMHNGSMKTLQKVIEFYNKGGGKGLGLPVDEQTLSARALNLSDHETRDIILFLESLTDSKLE
ncbi:cytochrome-c peroxidase [Dyadobacter pollutisoli]|uniref:Cytochrome C peroxidase n=1 Tax=Dyadobacter pollutisoli TaxID=2910158 RepID=A0A9E8SLI8_9BACT|nr:cytochrome c peroxidase [Dyadobacter pollutisoli]WAC13113.1 cytochrome C peroxidase [Dyadobacter pollutisoli]